MAKLTTLEGDFNFMGIATPFEKKSFLQADEVTLNGWSITKAARKTVRVTKNTTKAAVKAPIKVAKAVVRAPVTVAKVVKAPKAIVQIAKAATYAPSKLLDIANTGTRMTINAAFKAPEVIAPAATKAITKTAEFVSRHPVALAPVTGGASLLVAATSKKGRSNLFGRKSAIQQTGRFIQRHPYMTAPITGGASIIAATTTKRGRQALAGKKPGFRTAPGLENVEKDEYLALKNKSNRTPQEEKRLRELTAKGNRNVAMQAAQKKAEDEKRKSEEAAKAASGGGASGGGASGGGSSGGGSSPEGSAQESSEQSQGGFLGPALIAAGLGALLLL